MEAAAAAAGVSKGLGYAYFANRNELLIALLERELAELGRRADEGVRAATDFEGRIRAGIGAWFDAMAERGVLIGTLLTTHSIQGPLEERRQAWNRDMENFYGAIAEKEFGIETHKARVAAAILLSGMSGVLDRWTQVGDPRAVLEDTYVEVVMGALHALSRR
jgi:AcrR family transcriptional regulator